MPRRRNSFRHAYLFALGIVAVVTLIAVVGCHRSQTASVDAGAFRMELKIAPDSPSMIKPITLTLHLSDQREQPVNGAIVNGTLTMKTMDMGTTAVAFAGQGNGDYQAMLKSVDMSGPWNLAIEVSAGGASAKHAFEINVGD